MKTKRRPGVNTPGRGSPGAYGADDQQNQSADDSHASDVQRNDRGRRAPCFRMGVARMVHVHDATDQGQDDDGGTGEIAAEPRQDQPGVHGVTFARADAGEGISPPRSGDYLLR